VRCYHGLGDTIQFIRFLRPLGEVCAFGQPLGPACLAGAVGVRAGSRCCVPLA
jgi:hypothetical protein